MAQLKLRYYISFVRPANVVTAIADIIAGAAISGSLSGGLGEPSSLLLLVISTIGLYGGGIVFNDIFDLKQDRIERPERILPSGKLSLSTALTFGSLLLLMGIFAAALVSWVSGAIALLVALLALTYDKFSKHIQVLGPVNMGLCRAGNLMLGVSIIPVAVNEFWWLGIIPVLFISAVTLTSQKEAEGNNRASVALALGLDVMILIILVLLVRLTDFQLELAAVFMVIWFLMNASAKYKAITHNVPQNIMNAVRMGVLSLIPLDAAMAAGFSGKLWLGLAVLLLLPLSIALAKKFAVT
ncbi:MAG: UbiA-like protein EboC [Saprospiraceae bacterium]|nr:UbiA-like protein EboC [Saprospiraceae bacterium]